MEDQQRCPECNALKDEGRCQNCKHVAYCRDRGIPTGQCKTCLAEARLHSNGDCKRCLKTAGMRECVVCHEVKLVLTDFLKGQYVCRGCKNPYRHMEVGERRRFLAYSAEYGLTYDQYNAIVEAQGGLCAICKELPVAVVDHDHANGRWRGVLCGNCNTGLGMFGDSPDRLRAAADYLAAFAAAGAGGAGTSGG